MAPRSPSQYIGADNPSGSNPKDGVDTAKARYSRLSSERESVLTQARESAQLTIPAIMPPEGHSNATPLYKPFQSAGAEGINNLASKLLLALFPPNGSFFRLIPTARVKNALDREADGAQEDVIGELEKSLGFIERTILERIELVGTRSAVFTALRHLIVCGNILVQVLEDGGVRLHYLDRYVCKRDPAGNVLEIIAKETMAKTALPEQARKICEEQDEYDAEEAKLSYVDVYTRVYRDGEMYRVYQELHGIIIPGSEGSYPLDLNAFIPCRFVKIDGEDYGRGRVEEYIGDFRSLESLSQSIAEGTAIAAQTKFLKNPAGITDIKALTESPNGSVVEGDVRDIGVLRVEKNADFQVGAAQIDKYEQRIRRAFLLSEQRQAERVTAEEVREVIAELERALGGVYVLLAQEFQLPYVQRVMHQMRKKGDIPALSKKDIIPKIITGVEALGRGAEYTKLRALLADTAQEFGQDMVAKYTRIGNYIARKAVALGVDIEGIIRSEEEVQQMEQQVQQMALLEKLGPQAVRNEGQLAAAQQQGEQSAQQPA